MAGLCKLGVQRSESVGVTLVSLVVMCWTRVTGIIFERNLFGHCTPTAPTTVAVHVLYGDLSDEPWFASHHQGGGVLFDDAGDSRSQWTGTSAALSMESLSSRQSLKLSSVARPLAVSGASPTNGVAELATDAAVRHPPGIGALGRVAGSAVVAAAGQVAVLAGLPGDGPAISPARMVDNKPQWHAVAVFDAV